MQEFTGKMTLPILCEILPEKIQGPRARRSRCADFVPACAIEIHIDISYPDLTPTLTPTVRTL